MHYYDKFKCYLRESSTIMECLFAGRKIKIVRFAMTDTTANVIGTPEEYYAYKNLEAEQIDFNENTVMIAGSRYADIENNDTFDHSGVFVYNRLKKEGGSPYVRQLISKDEIFDIVKSNKYKAILNNKQILIHGGYVNFVAVYNIGEYILEGRFDLQKARSVRRKRWKKSLSRLETPLECHMFLFPDSFSKQKTRKILKKIIRNLKRRRNKMILQVLLSG